MLPKNTLTCSLEEAAFGRWPTQHSNSKFEANHVAQNDTVVDADRAVASHYYFPLVELMRSVFVRQLNVCAGK